MADSSLGNTTVEEQKKKMAHVPQALKIFAAPGFPLHHAFGCYPMPRLDMAENENSRQVASYYGAARSWWAVAGVLFWLAMMLEDCLCCRMSDGKWLWYSLDAVTNVVIHAVVLWIMVCVRDQKDHTVSVACAVVIQVWKVVCDVFAIINLYDNRDESCQGVLWYINLVVAIILALVCFFLGILLTMSLFGALNPTQTPGNKVQPH